MRRRIDAALLALAACVAAALVFWPLFSATYPPMTDLPFHAAQTSAFRHYWDDAYHYRDQFDLRPIAVPYMSSYVLGALLMVVFSTTTAVKLATGIMLLLLPAGLATLAWGMRKSPLLGMLGVPFAWGHLTHWGFINFVGALGLFAMAAGLALRALDVPSRRTEATLAGVLVFLFFTHVFRYPFAVAAVLGAAVVTYPVHKRIRPVLWPLVPSLVLFTVFWFIRPKALVGGVGPLEIQPARWGELFGSLVDGFHDPSEARMAERHGWVVLAGGAIALFAWIARLRERPRVEIKLAALTTLVPLGSALVFLIMFLTLPMEIGGWWYVYPREATAAAFLFMGVFPDVPEALWARVTLIGAIALSSFGISDVVARNYRAFDETTRDFTAISEQIPQAPKLLYLVFDHEGSTRTTTPYIHLPAWIQADRGGWLSFHFSLMGASPLVYRKDAEAVVPPDVPVRWEWTPDRFNVREQAPFFDWFLVRRDRDPQKLFRADPEITFVAHNGKWWLYKRKKPEPEP